jgi:hypothetical protein
MELREKIEHIKRNKIRSIFILKEGISRYLYDHEKGNAEIVSVDYDFITLSTREIVPLWSIFRIELVGL